MGIFSRAQEPRRSQPQSPHPQEGPAQQVLPLNEAEQTWVAGLLAEGERLGMTASPETLQELFTQYRTHWWSLPRDERPDPNPIIHTMGAVAGGFLVERGGLDWCLVSDQYGTELATTDMRYSFIVFPVNGVAKRWTGDNRTTLVEYLSLTLDRLQHLRSLDP